MMKLLRNIAAAALFASACCGDTVFLKDGKVDGQVEGIADGKITLTNRQSFAIGEVVSLAFSRPPVVAQTRGIILCDGSVLNGTLHELSTNAVVFRSTSLGRLTLSYQTVSAVYFNPGVSPADIKLPAPGKILAVQKAGLAREGELLAISPSRLVLRTDKGLEQMASADLLYLSMNAVKNTPAKIILRNGDRLNMPVVWKNFNYEVNVGTAGLISLTMDTLKEVRF